MSRLLLLPIGVCLTALAACNTDPSAPAPSATETSNSISFAKSDKHPKVRVVTESDVTRQPEDTPPTDHWVVYLRPGTGTGTFRDGPGNPPLGEGSFEFATISATDKVQLFNFDYVGERLADFTALGYSTFQSASANPIALPSINVTIDQNGGAFLPGDFATLVFEPVYNPAQGPIVPRVWQDWDAIFGGAAMWWLTRDLPGIGPRGMLATWNAWNAALPNATILGGVGLNQGSGNPALTASVDGFLVGVGGASTSYDFELCKKGHHHKPCKDKDKDKDHDDQGKHDE